MIDTENTEFDPHTLKADIGRAGLTITQVSEKSGVSQVTVSRWLSGSKPQAAVLKRFLDAFEKLKAQKIKEG